VSLEIGALDQLPQGAVLHWEFRHFVVLDRATRDRVEIVDPARGRRRLPMARFRKSFTGVALTFEPSSEFVRSRGGGPRIRDYLRRIASQTQLITKTITLSLLAQLLALASPLVMRTLVDRIVPHADWALLQLLGLGTLAIVGFAFFNSVVRAHLL